MAKHKSTNARMLGARAVQQVIQQQRSLTDVLPEILQSGDERQGALIHQLTAGTLRYWWPLSAIIDALLKKPLKPKDFDIYCLTAVGIYQINHTRIPEHAIVSETVNAVKALSKPWAKNLVNALLRNYQRDKDSLDQQFSRSECFNTSHPQWMIDTLKQDWPQAWQNILSQNNKRAPLTLRVNQQQINTEQAIKMLSEIEVDAVKTRSAPDGLTVDGKTKIWQSPLWQQAKFSVQDESAQLVGYAVALKPAMKVLDACAAPGGKTAHLLEIEPGIDLLALELKAARITRMRENLKRLKLSAQIKQADASHLDEWWQGELYDLVIIDAPCSGSGVIRKHPDIKHLRHPQDITQNVETQRRILDKLWSVLKVGGKMLYCTCSVFRSENDQQASWLLECKPDAIHIELPEEYGLSIKFGRQRLPGVDDSDGFYYACFEKRPS